MNFQAAKNNPGNFVVMQGTAVKFDIKTGQYGNYALGNMVDNTGLNEKVFYAASEDSPLPDASIKNQLGLWGVKFDANTQKFKVYFNALVQQQAQGHQGNPQNPPQPPQPAGQPTNAPPREDIVALRSVAFNIASTLYAKGKVEYSAMYFEADIYVEYMLTGKHPTGVAGANPPGTMDGSPMDDFPQELGSQG